MTSQLLGAMAEGKPRFIDLHQDGQNQPCLDLLVPICNTQQKVFGAILFQIEPRKFLYPLISHWPKASKTAETVLVRQDGDDVLFLSPLRGRADAALTFRMPVSTPSLPSALTLRGAQVLQGVDYRGVPVVFTARRVDDMPWVMIAKVDAEEVFTPIVRQRWIVSGATGLVLLVVAVSFLLFIHRKNLQHFRKLYQLDHERKQVIAHYENIVRLANDIVMLVRHDGQFIEVNERALSAYGYSMNEMLSMGIRDIRDPALLDAVERDRDLVKQDGGRVFETRHRRKDGSIFPVEVSSRAIEVNGQVYFQSIIRDITRRKEAELQLRESEQSLAVTLESIGDAVIATDTRGRITRLNKMASSLTGWSATDAVGRPLNEIFDIFNELTHQVVENPVDKVLHDGRIVSLANHTMLRAKDGSVRPIADSGAPIRDRDGNILGVVLVFRDQTHERQVQKTLRSSVQKYRQLFNGMDAGCALHEVIFDPQGRPVDFRFIEVNPAFERLSHRRAEEIVGKRASEFPIEFDQALIEKCGQVALTGLPFRYTHYSSVTQQHYDVLLYRPEENRFAVIFSDITQQCRAQAELQKVNRALQAISECNQALVRAKDEDTLLHDICRIINSHMAYRVIWVGMPRRDEYKSVEVKAQAGAESVGQIEQFRISWADTPQGAGPTGAAIRTGEMCYAEDVMADSRCNIWRPQYAQFGVHSSLAIPLLHEKNVLGALTIGSADIGAFDPDEISLLKEVADDLAYGIMAVRDRLERRRATEELAQAFAKIHEQDLIISKSPVVAFRWSAAPGWPVLYVSDSIQQFGYRPQDIVGSKNWPELLVHPDDFARVSLEIQEHARQGGDEISQIFRIRTRDGSVRWVDDRILVHRDSQGAADYFQGIMLDINDRMAAEESLRESHERMHQMEKMEAIGQLAGGVAHDFNNMLTVILGNAELLRKRLANDAIGHRMADDIVHTARRTADLTRKLLTFARKGKYQAVPVDIHKMIHEVVELLQHSIDKRIQIETSLNASPCTTTGDPSQLQNALLNLGLNARDAMPDGGKLAFGTEIVVLDLKYCQLHPYQIQPGQYIQISILDTGVGMSKEVQSKLFQPFFTTKEVGRGTGLGLASVYGCAKQHNGTIHVYSELGRGSHFKLMLPLAAGEHVVDRPARISSPVAGVGRILLVDDEEMVSRFASDVLRQAGYDVSICSDGQKALAFYQRHLGLIDLVILDLIMPVLDGADTFRQLKQVDPNVRVLISSGFSIDGTARSLLDSGALDFLAKPFQVNQLLDMVARYMPRRP